MVMFLLLFHLFTLVAPLATSPTQISPGWEVLSFNITRADLDPNDSSKLSTVELSFELRELDTKNVFLCVRDSNSLDPKSRNTPSEMLPLGTWQVCKSKTQRNVYFRVNSISSSEQPVIDLDIFQMIIRNDSYIKPPYKT